MTDRLKGKVAIVTGASRGIGKAIAQLYAAEGAQVLVTYHSKVDEARETVASIKAAGGEASLLQADVSKRAANEKMAQTALKRYGRIDVLCANAGIYPRINLEDLTEADWDRVHDVNLKGMFLSVKACLPTMQKQQYGRIVVVSSTTGPHSGMPGHAAYGASKGGMNGFIRNACLGLAKYQITINAVSPGMIDVGRDGGAARIKQIAAEVPLKRMGKPMDVAWAALFLATDEASYITGQEIVVDGGLILPELPLKFFGY